MEKSNLPTRPQVVEAEILDENGQPIHDEKKRPEQARPQGDLSGVLGGILVLAFGFIMTLLVAAFSILVVLPLMLLGRLFGLQIKTFRR